MLSNKNNFPVGAAVTTAELETNLHPVLHRLRAAEPVSWIPATDCWLITDRETSVVVMRDAKTYTVDHPGFSTGKVVGPSMLSLDGATHLHHRAPFEKPFRKREVEARFTGSVSRYVDGLIDSFCQNGHVELRRAFCGPIAVKTMVEALGMEETPVQNVLGWYDTIVDAVTRVTAGEPVPAEGKEAFQLLKSNLLPALQKDTESSLLAAAAGIADGLTDDEIMSNAAVLLFGGIETTEGMIANAMYHLLTHPDILTQVVDSPDLIPAVIEESLRMEPAASVIDRYTTRDVQLGDAHILEGDLVRISLAGANRDPATFPNPDSFDPRRPNLRSHVTWAQGPHVCLGLHLARLEAQKSLEQLLTRLPDMHLQNLEEARPVGLVFRKPQALNVTFSGAGK